MKAINQLREMSVEDLQKEVIDMRRKQLSYRLKKASGALEKTHVQKQARRYIAQIKTIVTEKCE